ncbi:Uncharacterised protein [Mycobacterium tuberculosis]|nr:Uncharacterised protein [Mycobacterium tuberculosis]
MKTAQAFEVGRVGGPTVGERDGVIQVALGGRAVATGRPTGQIPGPHKRRQLHRGPITRLGPGRDRDRLQPGGLGQLGHQLGRDQPVAAQQRCRRLAVALDAGLLGHHMNHHRRHRAPLGGTVGIVAAAGPADPPRPPTRPARRRGADLCCADHRHTPWPPRRSAAHPGLGRRWHTTGRTPRPCRPRNSRSTPPDRGPAPAPGAPHRGRPPPRSDLSRRPAAPGHRRPAPHPQRQLGIHPRQHLRVGDQIGAIHQRLKHVVVDFPGSKHLPDLRQPLPHRPAMVQVTAGPAMSSRRRGVPGRH